MDNDQIDFAGFVTFCHVWRGRKFCDIVQYVIDNRDKPEMELRQAMVAHPQWQPNFSADCIALTFLRHPISGPSALRNEAQLLYANHIAEADPNVDWRRRVLYVVSRFGDQMDGGALAILQGWLARFDPTKPVISSAPAAAA